MLGYILDINPSANDPISSRLMIQLFFREEETDEKASGGHQDHGGQEEDEGNGEGKEGEREEDRT